MLVKFRLCGCTRNTHLIFKFGSFPGEGFKRFALHHTSMGQDVIGVGGRLLQSQRKWDVPVGPRYSRPSSAGISE